MLLTLSLHFDATFTFTLGVLYDQHAGCMQSVDAGLSDVESTPCMQACTSIVKYAYI